MAKCLRLVCAICIAVTLHFTASSQSLSVNTTGNPANASAILDVESTLKGMLLPRMSKTQKNAIPVPATGLLVYQTTPDSIGFHYYDGTKWVWLSNNSPIMDTINWKTHGNSGLSDSITFLGNIDNVPINFRVNNQRVGRFDPFRLNYFIGRGSGAGSPLAVGHIAMGDSAGADIDNNYAGIYLGYRSGVNNTGTNNTFVGSWTGEANTTGSSNAFFGTTAGIRNTTGNSNAFIGHFAAYFNTTGSGNTAVGTQALYNDTTGSLNVAVGYQSMVLSRNTHQNTAVGSYSLYSHRINPYNVAVGEYSLFSDTSGTSNAALGTSSLRFNLDGDQNTAIGTNAMMNHAHNDLNTAVGYQAMEFDSAGALNVAVGWRAFRNNKTGIENTAIGVGALEFDSTGNYNTAVGRYAGFSNKQGNYTTFMGYESGYYNKSSQNTGIGSFALTFNNFTTGSSTDGIENTGIGYGAGYLVNLGSKNTAIGHQSMRGISAYISGDRNVAVGDSAMTYITSGSDNVAVGVQALGRNTYAYSNVAVGGNALRNNTSSVRNTAVGDSAMYTQSYDPGGNYLSDNTAIGSKAMFYNQPISTGTGTKNTAVGSEAMYLNTTGNQNTVMGVSALRENTTGTGNTVMGRSASRLSNTGNYNSYYGYETAYNDSSGSYNIAMGYQASLENDTASFTIAIGPEALYYNTVDSNIAMGFRAGYWANTFFNYPSKEQTFIGNYAGIGSFVSSKNTAIGFRALAQTNAVGTSTDYNNGGRNTVVGDSAMAGAWGGFNVAIGAQVMSTSGLATHRNVAIGDSAMGNAVSPDGNVAVGYKSLSQISNQGNTAVGAYSLQRGENTIWNTAIGFHALETDTTGSENTVIGTSAFRYNPNGIRNVSLGINTGYWSTSSNNTYIGSYAGEGASGLSTGGLNVAVGDYALLDVTSGTQNVSIGSQSSTSNTTGSGNTALGYLAGNTNITGTFNTLMGYNTDVSSSALINAAAIGANAFAAQNNSVVLGSISGINGAGTTASVGIGTNTPGGRLHIRRNGASGGSYIANASLLIEDNTNSFIHLTNPNANENGILSGNVSTTIRSGIVFGNDSTIFLRTGGNTNRMIINKNGYVGVGTTAIYPVTQFHLYEPLSANVNLRVSSLNGSWEPGLELTKGSGGADWKIFNSTGNLFTLTRSTDDFVTPTDYYEWGVTAYRPATDNTLSLGQLANRWTTVYATAGAINTSDARDKENITNLNYGLNEIMKLRPVSYTWKENPQWGKKIGFIAQEVQPILGEVVQAGELKSKNPSKDADDKTSNVSSDKLGIYYSDIIPVAVKAIQEQQKIIEDLKKKNEQLEKDMQAIKAKLGIK
jgi:hypothetical protein